VGDFAELPEPHWQALFRAAQGLAVKGVGTRRAVHALAHQAGRDRLAVEAARDQFIGILAEQDDLGAQRALGLLEAVLYHGDRHGRWGSGAERPTRAPGRWLGRRGASERFR
jgi:hypothetical protein